jgi:hypothetical protein
VPVAAVRRVKKASTGFNSGVLTGAAVLDTVAAFGFVIVERRVGEIDVATGDDLAVLVSQLRGCTAITPNLQIATGPDQGRGAKDDFAATGSAGEFV